MFTWSDMPDLRGTTAVVTGANSGLGLRTARALAGAGATTVMTARSRQKFEAGADTILPGNRQADLRYVELDLADLASVERAATRIAQEHEQVDLLVNNAGVMLTPEATTADGLELQLGTNHFGHFALTGRLLGPLLAADAARVVTVSSLAHRGGSMDLDDPHQQERNGYDSSAQYGRSKLANLLFALELQRRFDDAGVAATSVAAHPGWTATNLQSAGVRLDGRGLLHRVADLAMTVANPVLGMDVEQGALPQVWAAVGDVPGGTYWGPRGPGEVRGPVGPARISAAAQDPVTARRLWELSVGTTGVDFGALEAAAAVQA